MVGHVSFLEDPGMMLSDEEQYYADEEKKTDENSVSLRKSEENEGDAPTNEKAGNYYKDIKHCEFFKLIAYIKS